MDQNPAFYFDIGGITFHICADIPITDTTFHAHVMKYRSQSPSTDTIQIYHHFGLPNIDFHQKELAYRRSAWSFFHDENGWTYHEAPSQDEEQRLEQVAFFNEDHSIGHIYHPDDSYFRSGGIKNISLRSTDQILFAHLLAYRQAFILHSAAMNIAGRGFLFAGHSGAGKSTAINLLKDTGLVIGEDRNIVRLHPEGWRVYGFFHLHEQYDVSPLPVGLSAIFLLEQAPINRLIPVIDRKEIARQILPLVIKAMTTVQWWQLTLDLIEKLISQVPVYRLQFQKNGHIEELIRELYQE